MKRSNENICCQQHGELIKQTIDSKVKTPFCSLVMIVDHEQAQVPKSLTKIESTQAKANQKTKEKN